MISFKTEWLNQIKSNKNYWKKEKNLIKKESKNKMSHRILEKKVRINLMIILKSL